LLACMG